jgi:hypothetical protein
MDKFENRESSFIVITGHQMDLEIKRLYEVIIIEVKFGKLVWHNACKIYK